MADRIQLRRDTKANWEQYNPILLEGEPGHVLDDPNLYKMGDGVHNWNDLPYRGYGGTVLQEVQLETTNAVPSSAAVWNFGAENLNLLKVNTLVNLSGERAYTNAACTAFIPVNGGETIIWHWGVYLHAFCKLVVYSENKAAIDEFGMPSGSERELTLDSNVRYIRATFTYSDIDNAFIQIKNGDYLWLPKSVQKNANDIKKTIMFIPQTLSDAQKLQVCDNIGALNEDVFLTKRVITYDDDIVLYSHMNNKRFITPFILIDKKRYIKISVGSRYHVDIWVSDDGQTFAVSGIHEGTITKINHKFLWLNIYVSGDVTAEVSFSEINFKFEVFSQKWLVDKINSCGVDNTILTIENKFINTTGQEQTGNGRVCSDFISVSCLPIIVKYQVYVPQTTANIACYDANKEYLGDYNMTVDNTWVHGSSVVVFDAILNIEDLPADTAYIRLNGYLSLIDLCGLHKLIKKPFYDTPSFAAFVNKGGYIDKNGNVCAFEPYYYTDYIKLLGTDIFVKNLRYNIPYVAGMAFYDANYQYICDYIFTNFMDGNYFTGKVLKEAIPSNAVYIRCSTNVDNGDAYVVQLDDVNMLNRIIELENQLKNGLTDFIALPKKPVPLINGETYYLYIDNMLNKPIDKYCHKYIYNSGIPTVNRKRLSVLTPNSLGLKNIGMAINDQMSLYIAGYNKFFQAEVIDGTLLNNKSAKILTVGDSFTDIGGWMAYEKAKLESFGASIEFIGNTNSHDPNRKCEGWGGAKAEKYAIKWGAAYEIEVASTVSVQTHARYTVVVDPSNNTTRIMTVLGVATFSNKKVLRISQDVRGSDPWTTIPSSGTITKESGSGDASISYTNLAVCDWNPFWDVAQNKLSFTTYCNKWNVNPDILFLQFMHNDVKETTSPIGDNTFETGITTDAQFNAALDKLEALISTWYTEMGSSKKIVVALQSLTIVDGGPSLIPQYWKYIEKFYERYQNDNRIIVMPVYPFVDNINGYPTREITPCPYYPNDKEIEATDGHPYTAWEQYGHCTAAGVAKAILEMV